MDEEPVDVDATVLEVEMQVEETAVSDEQLAEPVEFVDERVDFDEPEAVEADEEDEEPVDVGTTLTEQLESFEDETIDEPVEPAPEIELDALIASIDKELEAIYGAGTPEELADTPGPEVQWSQQYVIFKLGDAQYATQAMNVREVAELADVTVIPNVPEWLVGVTNLRGDILSLINLQSFLGLGNRENEHLTFGGTGLSKSDDQVMVVQAQRNGRSISTGLIVDNISDIRYLAQEKIGELTAPIENKIEPYLSGVYEEKDQMLILLDMEKLLLSSDMWQFDSEI